MYVTANHPPTHLYQESYYINKYICHGYAYAVYAWFGIFKYSANLLILINASEHCTSSHIIG